MDNIQFPEVGGRYVKDGDIQPEKNPIYEVRTTYKESELKPGSSPGYVELSYAYHPKNVKWGFTPDAGRQIVDIEGFNKEYKAI